MENPPTKQPVVTPPTASKPLYAVFNSAIDAESAKKFVNNLIAGGHKGFTEYHVLFQTNGGSVSDGIFMYDFLRSFPFPFTFYSAGSVQSIGTTIFLGAQRRIAGKNSLFMLHRTSFNAPNLTGAQLANLSGMATLEDKRTADILREHITLSPKQWDDLGNNQFWFTATDAVTSGLAHATGDFVPPQGVPMWSLSL